VSIRDDRRTSEGTFSSDEPRLLLLEIALRLIGSVSEKAKLVSILLLPTVLRRRRLLAATTSTLRIVDESEASAPANLPTRA